jgi:hypothetical protein
MRDVGRLSTCVLVLTLLAGCVAQVGAPSEEQHAPLPASSAVVPQDDGPPGHVGGGGRTAIPLEGLVHDDDEGDIARESVAQ